jgi:hypothetical protein
MTLKEIIQKTKNAILIPLACSTPFISGCTSTLKNRQSNGRFVPDMEYSVRLGEATRTKIRNIDRKIQTHRIPVDENWIEHVTTDLRKSKKDFNLVFETRAGKEYNLHKGFKIKPTLGAELRVNGMAFEEGKSGGIQDVEVAYGMERKLKEYQYRRKVLRDPTAVIPDYSDAYIYSQMIADPLTWIPSIGLEATSPKGFKLGLEAGLPYSGWRFESGTIHVERAKSPNPDYYTKLKEDSWSGFGKRIGIKLGWESPEEKQGFGIDGFNLRVYKEEYEPKIGDEKGDIKVGGLSAGLVFKY